MNRAALLSLSRDDLIALILAQHAQIKAQAQQISSLTARIAELEAKLAAPDKTPGNSSIPPSKGQKSNLPDRPKKPRSGRPGVARALAEHPDRIIEATLAACPHCAHALGPADLPEIHAYDHIDLPPLRPIVTRVNRHRGICPCCQERVAAPAPEGFEAGSPFGPGLSALIIHLHVTQAIGFQRLARLMVEVFGVTISEGAIANILARAQAPLVVAAQPLAQAVRTSPVVGSDETSARVAGLARQHPNMVHDSAFLVSQRSFCTIVSTDIQEDTGTEIGLAATHRRLLRWTDDGARNSCAPRV